MQFFYWLALLIIIGIAIFAVQNSTAPSIVVKFLLWKFETSLIYMVLGCFGGGILLTLFFCIPRAIRSMLRSKELRQEVKNLESALYQPASIGKEGDQKKG